LLEGAYQYSLPDSGFTGGSIMTFSKDGSLLVEGFSNFNKEDQRCLTGYREGKYTLIGEKFTVKWTAAFSIDPSIDFYLECIPKESFIDIFNPEEPPSVGTLVLEDGQNAYTLQYPCNDTGNCIGAMYFTKVK